MNTSTYVPPYFPYSDKGSETQPFNTDYERSFPAYENLRNLQQELTHKPRTEETATLQEGQPIHEREVTQDAEVLLHNQNQTQSTPLSEKLEAWAEYSITHLLAGLKKAIKSADTALNTTHFARDSLLLMYTASFTAASVYTLKLSWFIQDNNTFNDPKCDGRNLVSGVDHCESPDDCWYSCTDNIGTQVALTYVSMFLYAFLALPLLLTHCLQKTSSSPSTTSAYYIMLVANTFVCSVAAFVWFCSGGFQRQALDQYMTPETCTNECHSLYRDSVFWSNSTIYTFLLFIFCFSVNKLNSLYNSTK